MEQPRAGAWRLIHINGKSIGVAINDGNMGRAKYGVYVSGSSENVRIEDIETSENAAGYYFDTTGKYHHISNVHGGVRRPGHLDRQRIGRDDFRHLLPGGRQPSDGHRDLQPELSAAKASKFAATLCLAFSTASR